MVGPTCVQAGQVCRVTSFLLPIVCRCFFDAKGELLVPLASQGSLSYGSVSEKLEAEQIIEKGLRVPRGMQRADANGVSRFESAGAIMQKVIMIVGDEGHFTWVFCVYFTCTTEKERI